MRRGLDCVVIGYNDPPFERYAELLRQYGVDSPAYRDLKLSSVTLDGKMMGYVDLLNRSLGEAWGRDPRLRSGDIPSLAAAYLVSYLRRHGASACYINLFQEEKNRLAELLAEGPLCVAITTTLYVLNFPVNEMVEFIRAMDPTGKVKIVVGGPLVANHVRNYQGGEGLDAALQDLGADYYVCEAQGEATLAQLVRALRDGGDLAAVPNLYYFEAGRLVSTAQAPENNSLDEHHVDWRLLADHGLGATVQTRTARSCAFKCSFCNYPARAGKLTLASVETVQAELDALREAGVRNVVFIDDTFNVPLPRFKALCQMMIRQNYPFRWFSYFRCSNSDAEAVELMARSGCGGVFLGIESGSPTILTNMDKAATIEKYREGIRMLREHGILTFGSFITGFPGETDATVAETVDFLETTGLDYYRTQLWYCEHGTPIERRRELHGIEGEGFVWSHATMDSLEAMDHIERIFLSVTGPIWLPQWSYDFWILPYLLGKGFQRDQLDGFHRQAQKLMALEVATLSERDRQGRREALMASTVAAARTWQARNEVAL
ncbi:MAG: PhpK family radical SAM P-methyltransferase [Thermoanaerobaculia bacterium]